MANTLNNLRTYADRQEVTTLAEGFERAREVAIANERKWRTIYVLDQARDWFFKVYGPTADLEDPTRDRLVKLKLAMQGYAPNSVNRVLRNYKRVLRLHDIHTKIEMRRVPKRRVDALTNDDLEQLLRFSGHLYPIILFLIDTGARRTEGTNLRWEDVDLGKRRARIIDAKSGDERTVPLTKRVVEVLSGLPRGMWVFRSHPRRDRPYAPDALSRAVRKAFAKAGLREANDKSKRACHTLRKSFATRAAANNVPLKVAMSVGGWKVVATMLGYYVDVTEDDMEAAVDKLAEVSDEAPA